MFWSSWQTSTNSLSLPDLIENVGGSSLYSAVGWLFNCHFETPSGVATRGWALGQERDRHLCQEGLNYSVSIWSESHRFIEFHRFLLCRVQSFIGVAIIRNGTSTIVGNVDQECSITLTVRYPSFSFGPMGPARNANGLRDEDGFFRWLIRSVISVVKCF